MFVFSLVVFVLGVALILLAPFSGPSVPLMIFNALIGVVFLVMSVGLLMGWPLRLVIHSSLAFTALNLIYECVTSGGVFKRAAKVSGGLGSDGHVHARNEWPTNLPNHSPRISLTCV